MSTQCKVPPWSCDQQSIYDIDKSYADNFAHGPHYTGPIPERVLPPKEQWLDFFGTAVASPIGVPAGPLLSSKWTTLAGKLGYDVVTYKTIRSSAHAGHPLPNVLYLDRPEQLQLDQLPDALCSASKAPGSLDQLAITNSFGMPSQPESFLKEDIPAAQKGISPGQALVVSITGAPSQEKTLLADFTEAAQLAVRCGATIIEANFSCPNVTGQEGSLFRSPDNAAKVALAIRNAIGDTPLIIKVGALANPAELLCQLADSGVNGVSGINTMSLRVVSPSGTPALSPSRPTSGVCGAPIFETARQFVAQSREVIEKKKLALTLIGVGGVVTPLHIQKMIDSGANFVQTATGMMWDPLLATRYHLFMI